jgi:tetratricopeptide (TPR) repeat protein
MKPRVFVVMPFSVKEIKPAVSAVDGQPAQPSMEVNFDDVYNMLIAPAVERVGCRPFRADQEPGAGSILTDMYFELVTADAVLADISILNANVFYELGVRHGVSPHGVYMIHAGWSKRPFDISTERIFDYEGTLFEPSKVRDDAWQQAVSAAADKLAATLSQAFAVDEQTTASPVYNELKGLKPVDWSAIETARAKYFGGVLDQWMTKISIAKKNGYPGDILTLAEDVPTRMHQEKLMWHAAKGLIDLRRFDPALDVLRELIEIQPQHRDAQCQIGLVLGRLGKIVEAEAQMATIAQKYCGDPEAQGILGRAYKDMWRIRWETGATLEERQKAAVASAAFAANAVHAYDLAQRHHLDSYYNGINVISLLTLLKHLKKATNKTPADPGIKGLPEITAVVRFAARSALERAKQENNQEEAIWAMATLAELELVTGKPDEAISLYQTAVNSPGVTYFQIDSMQDQLRLFESLGFQAEVVAEIQKTLSEGLRFVTKPAARFNKVVVFSGHMIDEPDRKEKRFPPEKEDMVRAALTKQLDAWGIGEGDVAMCGGARGGDILLAELCAERQAHVRLFVPLPEAQFLEKSVRLPGSNWEARYFELRKHPQAETCFQPERLGTPPHGLSEFARNNLWIINTARVEAKSDNLYALLVWDEKLTGDGPGGTSDFAEKVKQLGGRLHIINPTLL